MTRTPRPLLQFAKSQKTRVAHSNTLTLASALSATFPRLTQPRSGSGRQGSRAGSFAASPHSKTSSLASTRSHALAGPLTAASPSYASGTTAAGERTSRRMKCSKLVGFCAACAPSNSTATLSFPSNITQDKKDQLEAAFEEELEGTVSILPY